MIDPDEVTEATSPRYLEYVFPVGLFEESLTCHGYTNVQATPDREKAHCLDIAMRHPQGVDRAVVRQHLDQVVQQMPETPMAHLQWRVELSLVVVIGQQISAVIKVSPVQMEH